jgi:hypothetical protein
MECVSKYFPKNLKYGTKEYFSSFEYDNLKKIILHKDNLRLNLKSKLNTIFKNYFVNDFSSPEYWCYEYIVLFNKVDDLLDNDIELIKYLGNCREDLYLFVSKICNCYYYYHQQTKLVNDEWFFEVVEKKKSNELICMERYFDKMGYNKLTKEVLMTPVLEIETECKGKNEIKLFHLLFSDLYPFPPDNL